MEVRVGCCGWAKGRNEYFKSFCTVEIQSTFYKLPKIQTAERWREEAPERFVYCTKAWQAITHPPSSPTWRRSGMGKEELERREYGFLRPTDDNFEAWEKTLEICEAMRARICVIQCPASFKFSDENIGSMREFLSKVDRGGVLLAWEPRGDWLEHPEVIKTLCRKLDLIHAVDPFRMEPQWFGKRKIAYFRIHGLGKPSIYRYRFTERDLKQLKEKLKELKVKETFCMFNNVYMFEDARRFQRMLG